MSETAADRKKPWGGWLGLVPFLHWGEPYGELALVTHSRWRIKGHKPRQIQKLSVKGLYGLSSPHRAAWFIGLMRFDRSDPA